MNFSSYEMSITVNLVKMKLPAVFQLISMRCYLHFLCTS